MAADVSEMFPSLLYQAGPEIELLRYLEGAPVTGASECREVLRL